MLITCPVFLFSPLTRRVAAAPPILDCVRSVREVLPYLPSCWDYYATACAVFFGDDGSFCLCRRKCDGKAGKRRERCVALGRMGGGPLHGLHYTTACSPGAKERWKELGSLRTCGMVCFAGTSVRGFCRGERLSMAFPGPPPSPSVPVNAFRKEDVCDWENCRGVRRESSWDGGLVRRRSCQP